MRLLFVILLPVLAFSQRLQVHEAPRLSMPGEVDSNSPAFWNEGRLQVINSTGRGPLLSHGPDQFQLGSAAMLTLVRQQTSWPAWIEAVWVDPSGTVLAWYHQEHEYVCNGSQRPNVPRIGAAVSFDGGRTFWDNGVVLSSPDPPDCSAKNGYFAGGPRRLHRRSRP